MKTIVEKSRTAIDHYDSHMIILESIVALAKLTEGKAIASLAEETAGMLKLKKPVLDAHFFQLVTCSQHGQWAATEKKSYNLQIRYGHVGEIVQPGLRQGSCSS